MNNVLSAEQIAPGLLVKIEGYQGLYIIRSYQDKEVILREVAWKPEDQNRFSVISIYMNGKTKLYDAAGTFKIQLDFKTNKNRVLQLEDGLFVPERRRTLRTLEEHHSLQERIGPLGMCMGAFDAQDLYTLRQAYAHLIKKRFRHYQLSAIYMVTNVGVLRETHADGYFSNTPNNSLIVHLQQVGIKEHAQLCLQYEVFQRQFTEVK